MTGYEDAVKEASRFVAEKPLLDDHEVERINQILRDAIEFDDAVDLIIFEPDLHKSGGRVSRVTSRIKKIDETERKLVLENGRQIILENIIGIKTEDSSLDQVPW
ncbi:YolD-like family protein [Turicimonas muris]|uniref:YolD-like family protein n=1 Tax=Turicimonas muris TaxID=1796652 RepID=UPI00333BD04A